MENNLIILIEDEIRITRLSQGLAELGIDISEYLPNNARVIFDVMGLNPHLMDDYFKLIEQSPGSVQSVKQQATTILNRIKCWETMGN